MEGLGQVRLDGVCRERCAGNVWQPGKKRVGRDSEWIGDTGWQRMRIDGSDYQDLDINFFPTVLWREGKAGGGGGGRVKKGREGGWGCVCSQRDPAAKDGSERAAGQFSNSIDFDWSTGEIF